MRLERTKAFLRSLKGKSDKELQAAAVAMSRAGAIFGKPHLHSGTDIRRLTKTLFECRAGLELRLLFRREGDALVFVFAGNHDEVRGFLSNR